MSSLKQGWNVGLKGVRPPIKKNKSKKVYSPFRSTPCFFLLPRLKKIETKRDYSPFRYTPRFLLPDKKNKSKKVYSPFRYTFEMLLVVVGGADVFSSVQFVLFCLLVQSIHNNTFGNYGRINLFCVLL